MADNAPAGATPVAGGATPPQSPPASPAADQGSGEPATGHPDGLGDAGKRALDSMKAAKKAAEDRAASLASELEALKAGSQTEHDKAITKARKEGAAEASNRYQATLRRAGVKAALAGAGVNSELLDLATKDDLFAELTIDDDGEIDGLEAAITSLRKARPSLFAKSGDFGGGNRGETPATPKDMNALIRAAARSG